VEGVTPAKFRQNGQEYDIRVRLQEDQRNIKKSFQEIYIPNINNKLIRLANVSESIVAQGPAAIDRQDRSRYIQITADLASRAGLGDVIDSVKNRLNQGDLKLPPGMRFLFIGDSENFQDLGSSILLALSFAILFIYLVLTSLYESPITPFAIMLALPLALCGAFFALFITHESLSLFSILGIVMLLGVASKNSILLLDSTKRLMDEKKMDRVQALIAAGKLRLRPILMTSMALIAGTFPVALGLNEASKQRTGMGVAIIGGLVSSTLLTLIVVPSAYLYIDRFRVWLTSHFNRVRGPDLKPKPITNRIAS
jgi:HAE1 family hydrophobic/amphiphilic exporter-1